MQDEYYPTTGLPVSIVTPASEAWDYTTIANQQKLVLLSAPTPWLFAPTAPPHPTPTFNPDSSP